MKISEAKEQFVQLWGSLGSSWGINRTMAQVHAILLISPLPLSTEDIMEKLAVSRGNVNMNLRELMTWNLIYKEYKVGERREFFKAEKDIWEVSKRIAKERKRREIEPLLNALSQFSNVKEDKKDSDTVAFLNTVSSLQNVVSKMDSAVDTLIKAEESKFFGILVNFLK